MSDIAGLLSSKDLKPKAKTETLASWILDGSVTIDELIAFADGAKDSPKATAIEALELATKSTPTLAGIKGLRFAVANLTAKAPRVKWESARVIGNIARLHPGLLNDAINPLLANAVHEGTVVRWSAAFALGEILKASPAAGKDLRPMLEQLIGKEEKESIRKIYTAALKATASKR
jgi:hypothetical protein